MLSLFICAVAIHQRGGLPQTRGEAFDWHSIDLAEVKPSVEARRKISSKVASQYSVLPVTMEEGVLVVVW